MKDSKIKISDKGTVHVPGNVRMSITEIASLFDIYYQTAKRYIRAIEKSGIAKGDQSMSGTVEGAKIVCDYYGLDMIVAIAFHIQSKKAQIFREWLCNKVERKEISKMQVVPVQNYMLN